MTRFMLTLEESVNLVLHALEEGVGGEVFVRQMPAHTIADLAEVMLENLPKEKRQIINIGVRPGEKIHETLVSASEATRTVEMGEFYVILPQISIPAIEKKYKGLKRLGEFRYASDTTEQMSKDQLRDILRKKGWI
jgi:UDP-N-acetylglucosamine 4,6-dehydratase/5-epimerase